MSAMLSRRSPYCLNDQAVAAAGLASAPEVKPALQAAGKREKASGLARWATILALTAGLTACMSDQGDFGRKKRGILQELSAHADAGRTNPEIQIRDRAYNFQSIRPLDAQASAVSRFNALADAIASDATLLRAFDAEVVKVREKDRIRSQAARVFQNVTAEQRDQAAAKSDDNEALIFQTCLNARARATLYRSQLEALVLEAPEPEAVQTERNLTGYDATVQRICIYSGDQGVTTEQSAAMPRAPLVIKR